MNEGDYCVIKRIFSKRDFESFRRLSGDNNPLHHDKRYAAKTSFGECIVPLFLATSQLSAIAGEYLPGHRSLIMSNKVTALAPIFYGEEITFSAQIVKKNVSLNSIELRILGFAERDSITVVLESDMLVKVRQDPLEVNRKWINQGEIYSKKSNTVMIVGATSKIGEAIARRIAKAGRDMILVYFRDQGKALRLKKELTTSNRIAVKKFSSLRRSKFLPLKNQVWCRDLDTVVYAFSSPLGAGLHEMMDSNYLALRELTEAILPGMLSRQRGVIVGIGSGGMVRRVPGLDDYVAAKTAAAGYLRNIGKEFGGYGITTTVFSPDVMRTDFSRELKFPEEDRMLPEQAADELLTTVLDNHWKGGFIWSRVSNSLKGEFGFVPGSTGLLGDGRASTEDAQPNSENDRFREQEVVSNSTRVASLEKADDQIKLIVAEVLNMDSSQISNDSGIGLTPGWDSLKQIEILLQIERRFEIRFASQDFSGLGSVSSISNAVTDLSIH